MKGGAVTLPEFAPFKWPEDYGCAKDGQEIVTLLPRTEGDRIGPIGPYADFIALLGESQDGNPESIPYTARSLALAGPKPLPIVNDGGPANLRENIYTKLTSKNTNTASELSHRIKILEPIENVLMCRIEPFFGFAPAKYRGYQAKLPFSLKKLEAEGKLEIIPQEPVPWNGTVYTNQPAPQTTFFEKTGDVESIADNGTITLNKNGLRYTLYRGALTELT
jgi:hypothetical protein